ncbi:MULTISPECIES: multicopper oxidase domain-containing protein [Arthrobacter]|uniref:Multicopper oxidase domain-containing protein n=2 Tax=Arthrobacter TaxID=1663 RepID=A0ABU9KJG1_9MICC|nr:multicopper oxidase domain-containing protein [Arthrobacter sp. YJM1]MDP5226274.1 multicopper oxidase domain-containing protein [Arthrobacter sp. YJM1]
MNGEMLIPLVALVLLGISYGTKVARLRPGHDFVYRFLARQAGTFWYHSHQMSHTQVQEGLFGALVLLPAAEVPGSLDIPLVVHNYPGASRSLNGQGRELRQEVPAGREVRVRVINTDNSPISAWTTGAPYRLLAIDGHEVNGPTPVTGQKVLVTAGARADLGVTVPEGSSVRVQVPGASLLLSTTTAGRAPSSSTVRDTAAPSATLDPLSYGSPVSLPFDPSQANRRYRYDIGRAPGFLDGKPGFWWTVNGKTGRDIPAFPASRGDVVVISISNASGESHPMHLHGHHAVVLSRNGTPATGSPWWVDSLNVETGESYEVAFLADNPGLWMDHCHNLPHAAEGLMTHVVYEGVTTPFRLGADTGNVPE